MYKLRKGILYQYIYLSLCLCVCVCVCVFAVQNVNTEWLNMLKMHNTNLYMNRQTHADI